MQPTENRFEKDIQKFEAMDRENPPAKGAVLFVGSSSIRLWDSLKEYFAGIDVIQRGFGGAEFGDVMHFFDRIVTPYAPRVIVVYAGSLDLRREGGGPEVVLAQFEAFCKAVKDKLPMTKVCYISMKPSISKWDTIHLDKEANRLIADYANKTPNVDFIDIWAPMVAEGEPPPEKYFIPDLNHPSVEAYRLWAQVIRPFIV